MDDLVRAAMAKWPHVPDCYGWLGLDAQGQWFLRDLEAQAAGDFASGAQKAKGSLVVHEALHAFIGRNYGVDTQGCWFFQNGPQRVYVELELTPWVWRLQPDGQVRAHTGQVVAPDTCLVDEHGWAYLGSAVGLGVVHTRDVELLGRWLDAGRWPISDCLRAELPRRFGFVPHPQAEKKPA